MHKVVFGDYRGVLHDVKIDLIFTSPQYNIGSGGARNDGYRSRGEYDPKSFGGIRDYADNLPEAEYQNQQVEFLLWAADHLNPDGVLVYNHKPRRRNGALIKPEEWLLRSEVKARLVIADEVIWDRGSTHNHDKTQLWAQTERLYALRRPGSRYPLVNNKVTALPQTSDVWRINREHGISHPSPFPVALARAVILAWSKPGQMVCDPFSGSGSTGVAARQLGREFIGAEVIFKYVEYANARISEQPLPAIESVKPTANTGTLPINVLMRQE
jgi:DNA modification methylase